jgi:hypothetical protein
MTTTDFGGASIVAPEFEWNQLAKDAHTFEIFT